MERDVFIQGSPSPHGVDIGRPSIDPDLMLRMLIVGYCYGKVRSEPPSSMRSVSAIWFPSITLLGRTGFLRLSSPRLIERATANLLSSPWKQVLRTWREHRLLETRWMGKDSARGWALSR